MKFIQMKQILLFLFLFFVSANLCHGETRPSFIIFYSNNVLGEIEPCG